MDAARGPTLAHHRLGGACPGPNPRSPSRQNREPPTGGRPLSSAHRPWRTAALACWTSASSGPCPSPAPW
eukprot:9601372-Lingulodinium_polyedra.AAC.1